MGKIFSPMTTPLDGYIAVRPRTSPAATSSDRGSQREDRRVRLAALNHVRQERGPQSARFFDFGSNGACGRRTSR